MKKSIQTNQEKFRYPGTFSFQTEQEDIFFGRDDDTLALSNFIRLNQVVVLYSKSGLGKSSLLNAGIIPKFDREGEFATIKIRLKAHNPGQEETALYTTRRHIVKGKFERTYLDALIKNEPSMWHDVKEQQIVAGGELSMVLIFDQFEELFTYPESDILEFKEHLAELLFSRVPQRYRDEMEKQERNKTLQLKPDQIETLYRPFNLKIVLSIRSDRMYLLNQISDYIPGILKHCYELQPLGKKQVEDAIFCPAISRDTSFISPPFDFTQEAVDKIINFLSKNNKPVESFQLQVICNAVERKVQEQSLSLVDVADLGNLSSLIENYYRNQLADTIVDEKMRLRAQKLIEEGLIYEPEQRRLSLFEGKILTDFGIPLPLLRQLVDTRLVRAEALPDGGFVYELSHDSLVAPILKVKEERAAIEEKEDLMKEAEESAKKAREASRRQQKAILLSTIASFFAVVATLLFIYAYRSDQKAQSALSIAQIYIENNSPIKNLDYNSAYFYLKSLVEKGLKNDATQNDLLEIAYFTNETNPSDTILGYTFQYLSKVYSNPDIYKKFKDIYTRQDADTKAKLNKILSTINPKHYQYLTDRYFPPMVSINDQLKIAKTETTVWQYNFYCKTIGSNIQETASNWGLKGGLPVVKVDWYDAIEYANWLSERMGYEKVYQVDKSKATYVLDSILGKWLIDKSSWIVVTDPKKNGYRLPAVAEWQAAAAFLQDSTVRFSGSDSLQLVGWFQENSRKTGVYEPQPVAQLSPNKAGLFDMSGNVWEWCEEWDDSQKTLKAVCGGAFNMPAEYCRAKSKDNSYAFTLERGFYNTIGFRLCRTTNK